MQAIARVAADDRTRARQALATINQIHPPLAEAIDADFKKYEDLGGHLSLAGESSGTSAHKRALVRAALLRLPDRRQAARSARGAPQVAAADEHGGADGAAGPLHARGHDGRLSGRSRPCRRRAHRSPSARRGATRASPTPRATRQTSRSATSSWLLPNHTGGNKQYTYKDFLADPKLLQNFLNSTSVIDSEHRGTYSAYGFILDVPPENIDVARSKDIAIANRSSDIENEIENKYLEKKQMTNVDGPFEQSGLPNPEAILADTKPGRRGAETLPYNEVVVRGRTGAGAVKITAFFVKTEDGEMYLPVKQTGGKAAAPYVSDALLKEVRQTATRLGIPIVYIDEKDPSLDKVELPQAQGLVLATRGRRGLELLDDVRPGERAEMAGTGDAGARRELGDRPRPARCRGCRRRAARTGAAACRACRSCRSSPTRAQGGRARARGRSGPARGPAGRRPRSRPRRRPRARCRRRGRARRPTRSGG